MEPTPSTMDMVREMAAETTMVSASGPPQPQQQGLFHLDVLLRDLHKPVTIRKRTLREIVPGPPGSGMDGERYRREFHVCEAVEGKPGKLLFIMRNRSASDQCAPSTYIDIVAKDKGKEVDTGWTIERGRECCCLCCCRGHKTFFHRYGSTPHGGSRGRRGSHGAHPRAHIFGSAEEPALCCKRGRTPTIQLFDRTHALVGKGSGPACFGGCSGESSHTMFRFSTSHDGSSVAELVKPAQPKVGCDIVPEADFTLTFTGEQKEEVKAIVFGSIVLFDDVLSFFDNDWNLCQTNELGEKKRCTLSNCHCWGCLCPCACGLCTQKDCKEGCMSGAYMV